MASNRAIPKIVQLRHDAPEPEFRRLVADHVRSVGAFLAGSLAELRYEVLDFAAQGDDTDIDLAVGFTARPLGVLVLEAENITRPDSPGSMASSVPWSFVSRSGRAHVRVLNFPGLDADTRYRVRLLVIGRYQ